MRLGMVVLAWLCLGAMSTSPIELPASLSGYRTWRSLTPDAIQVPPPLAALCRPLSKSEFEKAHAAASKPYGPHSSWPYVRTYANPIAIRGLTDPEGGTFPPGSILAKEKLPRAKDCPAQAIAFMIKHAVGEFPESGGWEFQYHPTSAGATYATCIECHRGGTSRDYVFGRPKR